MLPNGIMLTENNIVDMVSLKLEELNFEIISSCYTDEKGIDIVAKKNYIKLLIEAKGGTTSIQSINQGKPFNRNQAKTHISVAIFKILQLKEENTNDIVGIALPYERHHYEFIESIKSSLQKLEVIVFWCDTDNVKMENRYLLDELNTI